jgi:type I restriction enzyme S subunit
MNVIIGSVGISIYTGCLSPVYYVFVRRNETDNPHYLNAVFKCSRFHKSLVRIGNGILAHRMRVPMELLKCELMPYPPRNEQIQIVDALSVEIGRINRVIAHFEREITLLREYRLRLIADVVTGKLDIRDVVKRLPKEAIPDIAETSDETELLDEEIAV